MLRVYNYMGIALVITGIVAYLIYTLSVTTDPALAAKTAQGVAIKYRNVFLTDFGYTMFVSPLKWVIMLAPLAIVFLFAARINNMSVGTAQMVFWVYAALVGASISAIFLIYTQNSIAQVFFVTAAAFGGLSLWGYTTRRDLSGMGQFLIMGVIGILIAVVVNIFLKSSALQFAISCITVLVFAGLTAYDTQRLKEDYYAYAAEGEASVGRSAIMGALNLYLNFINMFMALLSLFGNKE
jgi:FtsH-binding integral membrane protein